MLQRHTIYTQAVTDAVQALGHANNQDILAELQASGITASPTTVHRVSRRLCDAGVIACAPATNDGSMRYDAMVEQHDHFVCHGCDGLADIRLPQSMRNELNKQLKGCMVDGQLIIYGLCKKCNNKEGVTQ